MNLCYITGAIVALWVIGNIVRHRRRPGKVISTAEENCVGCKKCLKHCRRDVLKIVENENGKHISVENPNKCTACGDCIKVCKFNALKIVEK